MGRTKSNFKAKIVGGWALVAILPLTLIFSAVINAFLSTSSSTGSTSLVIQILTITNTLLLLFGVVGTIGFPVGIVLLILGYIQKSKT